MDIITPTRFRIVLAWAFLMGSTFPVAAQSVGLPTPRLLTITPMGGQVGTTFDVVISGEYLDQTEGLLFSDTRIQAQPKRNPAGTPIENHYQITIAPDCPAGLYEARVMTRLGVSSARIFPVGTLTEVSPAKPNRTLETAQPLPLNSVCNAAVAARAIDYYTFSAKKGQRLIVDCATRGIDSKLKATVIIADAAGRDILVERRGGVLDFTVPGDGSYVIKVHEATYKGGNAYYYRLGLWEQAPNTPIVRQPSVSPVNAFSWPPTGLPAQAALAEVEPNNGGDSVQKITLPCDIGGHFFPAADVDVYEFSAKKGEVWWIEVASERLDLPTDPAVLVQRVIPGQNGKPATYADVLELSDIPSPVKVSSNGYAYDGPPYNAGSSDVLGKLEIKEDGVYRLQVSDLFGGTRSVPHHAYRLVVRPATPDFAVVSWALHMELRNGDRNALSKPIALRGGATKALEVVAIRRDGFNGPIELKMEGLPAGVTAQGLTIPAGQSRGMMLISARTDAPRGYANVRFLGQAVINGKTVTHPCRMASMSWPIPDAWGEFPSPRLIADVPVSVSGIEHAPLTVTAQKPVFEARAGEKLTIPLTIRRTSEFSGAAIKMKTVGAGFERNPVFDLPLKADSTTVTLDLKALKVAPGEYHVAFLGGGVVKYCHQPDMVAQAEKTSKKMLAEVKSLEAVVQQVSATVQAAPPGKKDETKKKLETVKNRMKAASTALTAAQKELEQAKAAAKPRDIADIMVCEPFTIRVLPVEKK